MTIYKDQSKSGSIRYNIIGLVFALVGIFKRCCISGPGKRELCLFQRQIKLIGILGYRTEAAPFVPVELMLKLGGSKSQRLDQPSCARRI